MTHDHPRQLLTDARSPQTLTEAVDVSEEKIREEDRDRERHSGVTSMESDVVQQSVDMPHSGQDSKAQGSEVDESLSRSRLGLTRMDQTVATESNQPMYPPPGHDDPKHVTESSECVHDSYHRSPAHVKTTSSWTTYSLSDIHSGTAPTGRRLQSFFGFGQSIRGHQ